VGRASLPVLGPEIPRTGGPVSRAVGRWVLGAMRFRVEGEFPNLAKFVIIAVPHTSNWDFPLAMGAKLALAIDATWLGKHSIFVFPFSLLLRWLGGIPVDRSAKNDVVQQVTAEFARRDRMILALAPEGTRKKVERWRSGFYHIAHAAGVPIVPAALDWEARTIRILPAFTTTGAADADIAELRKLFEGLNGLRK
jgi:1-acyl-sn-glycerol-3-phosphate acyltransferase